jgi:hypothetical protein
MGLIYRPPEPEVLGSIAAQKLRWKDVIGELYDNSLDADAHHIELIIDSKHVSIIDDGKGCARPDDMITLGAHAKHTSTKLGRYGIGAKDAALWIGGDRSTVNIWTVHDRTLRTLGLDWHRYAHSNWSLEAPHEEAAGPDDIGTRIRITPNTRPLPRDMGKLAEELGYIYPSATENTILLQLRTKIQHKPLGTVSTCRRSGRRPANQELGNASQLFSASGPDGRPL